MVCVPTLNAEVTTEARPFVTATAVPMAVEPSRNWTVPLGGGGLVALVVMVADKVTGWPKTEAAGLLLTATVVVGSAFIVTVFEVLPLKLLSPE